IRHNQTDLNDPGAIEAVANTLGAEYFVRGNIYDIGGKMRFTASLHRTGEGVLASAESQTGVSDDLYQLIDDLGRQLLVFSSDTSGSPVQQLARRTTQSATALKAYLAGEARLRSEEYTKAIEYFQQAIAHDSTFAMAYYRLARAAGYQNVQVDRAFLLEKAIQLSEQLSNREKWVFQSMYNFVIVGDVKKTIALCRQIVSIYPNELEVWSILFEAITFHGPRLGEPIEAMEQAASRCIELAPYNPLFMAYQAGLALNLGDIGRIKKYAEMRINASPDGLWTPYERARLALILGDSLTKKAVLYEMKNYPASSIWFLSREISWLTRDVEDYHAVISLLKESGRSEAWRLRGAQASAYFAMSRGQRETALAEVENAEVFFPDFPVDEKLHYFLVPYAKAPASTLQEQVSHVQSWSADRSWLPLRGINDDNDQSVAFIRRNYALGLLFSELKDFENASMYADSLKSFQKYFNSEKAPEFEQNMSRALSHSIRANISFQSGKPQLALEQLGQINMVGWCANFRLQFVD
ncbi:hypothetical protein, partial [Nitrosomonas sp.]|uniref:tetratricopeptide repeat protein n=1 Tax=Nitrosomonas sp. TaxID=42353 RepID=UPI001E057252